MRFALFVAAILAVLMLAACGSTSTATETVTVALPAQTDVSDDSDLTPEQIEKLDELLTDADYAADYLEASNPGITAEFCQIRADVGNDELSFIAFEQGYSSEDTGSGVTARQLFDELVTRC